MSASATLGLGVGGTGYFNSAAVNGLFANTLPNVNMNATSNVGIDTTASNFTYPPYITPSTKGLVKLGGNTLTLTGAFAYSGPTTVSSGTLQLGDGTSGNDVSLATSGIDKQRHPAYNVGLSQTANYLITGRGSLAKTGTGSVSLASNNVGGNSYAGGTTLSQGVLALTGNSGLGSGVVTLSGGTLQFAAPAVSTSGIPLSVTGFNVDVIAENTAASPVAGTNGTRAGWDFYQQGTPGSAYGTGRGLPVNGAITSLYTQPNGTNTQFQLQPYANTNNIGNVNGGGSLTMTLNAPTKFSQLEVLEITRNAGSYTADPEIHRRHELHILLPPLPWAGRLILPIRQRIRWPTTPTSLVRIAMGGITGAAKP